MNSRKNRAVFINSTDERATPKINQWLSFLEKNNFDFDTVEKIDMSKDCPVISDKSGNKFSINFMENKQNYAKKKISIKKELISRALGAGRYGLNILDLSAGLGIDAVFLSQLGYSVTALERNPLIFLALNEAVQQASKLNLTFKFVDSADYLTENKLAADVIYFDPMFPEKAKSALPRQEMVFFRTLVGHDKDAVKVLEKAIQANGVKRVVVKRPISAPPLLKAMASIKGKLVRFDLYQGVRP